MQILVSMAFVLTLGFSMFQCGKLNVEGNKTTAKTSSNTVVETPTAATPIAQTSDEAPRIALADAKKDFDDGAGLFVDTRPAVSYNEEHIKGSINLSAADFDAKYKSLPKDKKIIAYCS